MKTRTKLLSDAELLWSAKEALRVTENAVDAVLNRTTAPAFVVPLLHEAVDAVRVANSALVTLRERAQGVKPPKLGD